MNVDENCAINESSLSSEDFRIQITNPMLYDRLHTLSVEYSVSVELLVNVAAKRLVDDVDFVRNLRTGKIGGAYIV
ncbi:MAG: hypothetical protein HDT15_07850 [Oscillibacter sp.]|nr:hypothetical protein [Oscillibacter sp.]